MEDVTHVPVSVAGTHLCADLVILKSILKRPLRGVLLRNPELFGSEPGDCFLILIIICGHRTPVPGELLFRLPQAN